MTHSSLYFKSIDAFLKDNTEEDYEIFFIAWQIQCLLFDNNTVEPFEDSINSAKYFTLGNIEATKYAFKRFHGEKIFNLAENYIKEKFNVSNDPKN